MLRISVIIALEVLVVAVVASFLIGGGGGSDPSILGQLRLSADGNLVTASATVEDGTPTTVEAESAIEESALGLEAGPMPSEPDSRAELSRSSLIFDLNRWITLQPSVEWEVHEQLDGIRKLVDNGHTLMPNQEKFLTLWNESKRVLFESHNFFYYPFCLMS